jgi:DNA-directed RNA polymerase subunit RPC12/RpoP
MLSGLYLEYRSGWLGAAAALAVLGALSVLACAALIRCRVCGERVFLTLLLEHEQREVTDIAACPVCGDPGDGSNPSGWRT